MIMKQMPSEASNVMSVRSHLPGTPNSGQDIQRQLVQGTT